ncbi:hypothetical protein LMG29542_02978 [Paraburkholderia humisilvae]|uniref:Uncharacterized protein n=1 Tax=Paraburkholderia humisilvae TaxID=627669 RepID=A0A6J5DSV3_9BURK|nr:hypothetical protein LMG29542_02978 [Paraburkholderia humisilvae]
MLPFHITIGKTREAPHTEPPSGHAAPPERVEMPVKNGTRSGAFFVSSGGSNTHANPDSVRSRSTPTDTASNWPRSYALGNLPAEYRSSSTPGVMIAENGGEFIVNGDHGYPVSTDATTGQHVVYDANNPASPTYSVTKSASGGWTIDTRLPGAHAAESAELPSRYASRSKDALKEDSRHLGIYLDDIGQQYLRDKGKNFPARHDATHQTWRIVQPDNPAKPGIPVNRNDDGSWSMTRDVGLPGGGDTRSQRFSELTNRKRSLESEIAHSQGRSYELQQRYDAAKFRFQAVKRSITQLAANERGLAKEMQLHFEAVQYEREMLDLEREREAEVSKYNYAKLGLHAVEQELASLNLSNWNPQTW